MQRFRNRTKDLFANRGSSANSAAASLYFTDDAETNAYYFDDAKTQAYNSQGGVLTPLRVIGVNEQGNVATDTQAGRDTQASRQGYVVGANAAALVFSANNWQIGFTNNVNQITIVKASLESTGGTVVPLYINGLRSKVLSTSDTNINFDPIPASAFGLPFFARNSQYWIKAIIETPTLGGQIQYTPMNSGDISGGQTLWYDKSLLTLDPDVPGPFPTAGTSARQQGFRFMMLGYPLVDGPSFFVIGDSISIGVNDGTANGAIGRGMIQRAMCTGTPAAPTNSYPCINMGKSGIGTTPYLTDDPRWTTYMQYAKYGIEELGVNSLALGLSTLQSNLTTIWALMKSKGITKILRTELMIRTTSTDNWATTANQTYQSADWANDGLVTQLNTWAAGQVGTTIEYYASGMRLAVADATVTDKWAVPKVNNADDVHPNTVGATMLATNFIRPIIVTM